MDKTNYTYIIIGAGIAGVSAIQGIRSRDSQGSILLVSNEDRAPYKRTQINKNMEQGFSRDAFALFSAEWYAEQKVDLHFGAVEKLDCSRKEIYLEGVSIGYTKLLLAMGAEPRYPVLPGIKAEDLPNVHFAQGVDQLLAAQKGKQHYLILGGGVEGVETADQLVKMGKQVTILQRGSTPFKKLFPEEISARILQSIKAAGVSYRVGEIIQQVIPNAEGYCVQLEKESLQVHEIIVCTGSRPAISLLASTPVQTIKGVLVDAYLQTSVPGIYAAGDVAEHIGGWVTGLWHPAEYQGLAAGKNMAGAAALYQPVPYRLKTDVFGVLYFSVNYYRVAEENLRGERYASPYGAIDLFSLDAGLRAAILVNDQGTANKKAGKLLQLAVQESWTVARLKEAMQALHLELSAAAS